MMKNEPEISLWNSLTALGVGLGLCIALILLFGDNPAAGLKALFTAPLTNPFHRGNMLQTAGLLIFTGGGTSLAFRAGLFNLGGEGQSYFGALVCAWVFLSFPPGTFTLLSGILAGGLAGMVLAGISAWLKSSLEVDEMISTFLLSAGMLPLIDWCITGPLGDPESYLIASRSWDALMQLPRLSARSRLDFSFILSLVTAGGLFFMLFFSSKGYEIRLSGQNRSFALYGGLSSRVLIGFPLSLAGGLHGLAGAFMVSGSHLKLIQSMTAGLGWNGITVALLGFIHPLGVIPAALIFSWIQKGTEAARLAGGMSFTLSPVLQGSILLFISCRRFRR